MSLSYPKTSDKSFAAKQAQGWNAPQEESTHRNGYEYLRGQHGTAMEHGDASEHGQTPAP
jgi:hypothetical protein